MFDFLMRYKIKKMNIVFDVLSRFSENLIIISKNGLKVLKTLYKQAMKIIKQNFYFIKKKLFFKKTELFIIYHIILIKMFDDFKSHFILKYIKNE